MKEFSIIIPAYNVEKYIKRCVDSVLNQTYNNYEVIIVNDGSTDKTLKILNKEYKNDNILIIDKENGGLSSARNAGIDKATGKYIIFLDSDDWWEEDLLKQLNIAIKKSNSDVVGFKLQKYYEKENKYEINNLPTFSSINGVLALNRLINSNLTFETAVCYAYKSKYWHKNKFRFSEKKLHEDFGLTPLVIANASKVEFIDYVGYNYYQREFSITKDTNYDKLLKKAEDTVYYFNFLKEKFSKLKLNNYSKELIANYIMNACVRKIEELNKTDQKRLYKKLISSKSYKIFGNGSVKSYIKKIMTFINPKLYSIFIK